MISTLVGPQWYLANDTQFYVLALQYPHDHSSLLIPRISAGVLVLVLKFQEH